MTTRSGTALQEAVAGVYRAAGYDVEVAASVLDWHGPRCSRCGTRHPTCGAKPRNRREDYWGAADVLAKNDDRFVVPQCGGKGSASRKRKALDEQRWPRGTWLVVVVRSRRKGARWDIWWREVGRARGWERLEGMPT